ncbi:MAG TPA: hypothetical protein VNN72_00180 [Polyangiaceae bacterium]|nr:hypothetical protein [Polyangiaceae bacterium]
MKRSILAWSLAAVAAVSLAQPARAQTAKPAPAAAPTTTSSAPSSAAKPAPAATTAAATTTTAAPAATTTAAPAPAPAATATATGTTAAPAAPPPGAPAASATTAVDGSTYVVRLRDLEQRVDELKEQIRRSHTRLSLLSDTILSGGVGGARAEIAFKNELSNAFHLTGATFVLDGSVQYNKQDDSGALAEQKTIPIFSGSIPPGDHTLQIVLKLRGHGYGVFSYLRGYKFNVPATHSFTVTEGKAIKLDAIVWEKGDVTTPLEERPAIRWQQTVSSSGDEARPESSPTPAAAPVKAGASGNTSKAGASGNVSIGAGAK